MLDLKYVDPIETSRDIYYVHCSAEAIGQNLNFYAIKLKRRLGFFDMQLPTNLKVKVTKFK